MNLLTETPEVESARTTAIQNMFRSASKTTKASVLTTIQKFGFF